MSSRRNDTNIEKTLSEYRYDNRKKSHPAECPLYSMDVKCHNLENLNCYLCYCPFYDAKKQEGGCLKDNPYSKGKWFEHPNLPKGQIWDCSDCNYPHIEKNIREYMLKESKDMNLEDLNEANKQNELQYEGKKL